MQMSAAEQLPEFTRVGGRFGSYDLWDTVPNE
jgi:hypothetical protein